MVGKGVEGGGVSYLDLEGGGLDGGRGEGMVGQLQLWVQHLATAKQPQQQQTHQTTITDQDRSACNIF